MEKTDKQRYFVNPYADIEDPVDVLLVKDWVVALIQDYVKQILLETNSEESSDPDLYVGDAGSYNI